MRLGETPGHDIGGESTANRRRGAGALVLAAAAVALLGLSACGGSGSSSSATAAPAAGGSAATAAPAAGGGGYGPPASGVVVTTAPPAGGAGGSTVTAQNFSFAPNPLNGTVGTQITFKNADSTAHTFTADDGSFDSDRVSGGGSFTFTPTKAGDIAFHCKIHSSMRGVLHITA